jgi:timeless
VLQSDLIPILKDAAKGEDKIKDAELLDLVLRLVVNLTNPEILLFREELPEDKATRNYYLQLQAHRQTYKAAFVDETLWKALSDKLGDLLKVDAAERGEEEQLLMERILILVRNVLQVPRDSRSERRTDDDVSMHDQVLWVLHKSGMEDLLLYVASSDDEAQYCLHVLEIISLMFKEQDAKTLASANFQRSKEEKAGDEKALIQASLVEQENRRKRQMMSSGRHSRFGGTYVVNNLASLNDQKKMIWHNPLQSVNRLDFDREKRPVKTWKSKMTPADSENTNRRSTLAIRLFLKEFCIEFLSGAYNKLMGVVKDSLNRQRAQQNDESYYLWAMRFFMEFNRCYKFRAELVSETLSKSTFHYMQQQIELYKDNFEHEKRNRPAYLLWSRRMHLALRSYGEALNSIVAMDNSKNPELVRACSVLKASVFYEPEYRELCLMLFNIYTPQKMSTGFLKDLVETSHVFLKIMEHMSKSGHLVVGKKVKKRKAGKGGGKSGRDKADGSGAPVSAEMTQRENKETLWDNVSSEISSLLQEDDSR